MPLALSVLAAFNVTVLKLTTKAADARLAAADRLTAPVVVRIPFTANTPIAVRVIPAPGATRVTESVTALARLAAAPITTKGWTESDPAAERVTRPLVIRTPSTDSRPEAGRETPAKASSLAAVDREPAAARATDPEVVRRPATDSVAVVLRLVVATAVS